MRNGVFLLIVI